MRPEEINMAGWNIFETDFKAHAQNQSELNFTFPENQEVSEIVHLSFQFQ